MSDVPSLEVFKACLDIEKTGLVGGFSAEGGKAGTR